MDQHDIQLESRCSECYLEGGRAGMAEQEYVCVYQEAGGKKWRPLGCQ